MGEVRACVYITVIILCFQICAAKPFFFGTRLWCDLFCDDDDILTTPTSASAEDDDWCYDCTPRRPRLPTTPPPPVMPNPGMMISRQPINLMMPPSNGMNFTMIPSNGGMEISIMPYPGVPGAAGGAAPPAGAAPAPPAATTPAATTVAPTTAAAAK